MRKRHYISMAIVFAGLLVSAWILLHPRQLPEEECSDTYHRYKDVEGVAASFIKGFPVNDTLSLDVTTLQATDSAGWERLKKDFHIAPAPEFFQRKIEQGEDMVSVRRASKNDPTLPIDTTDYNNNNVVAISRLYRTVSIFNTNTEAEQDAVSNNQLKL